MTAVKHMLRRCKSHKPHPQAGINRLGFSLKTEQSVQELPAPELRDQILEECFYYLGNFQLQLR